MEELSVEYSPELMPIIVRETQRVLDRYDLLPWSTIACTYTGDDNILLVISISTVFARPITIGFASFINLIEHDISAAERAIREKILGAINKVQEEHSNVTRIDKSSK